MLHGEMDIEDYIMLVDYEFPEYARRQARLLQQLHTRGIIIQQVHPWMNSLVSIHEFFAAGNAPSDIPADSPIMPVYYREQRWTKALMDFYKVSRSEDLQEVVEAVCHFAQEDANKIRDMDAARAIAIATILSEPISTTQQHKTAIYVECGVIHHTILGMLQQQLGVGQCTVRHALEHICIRTYGRRRLLAPGDVLTFRYLLTAKRSMTIEKLLAARALIYNKLIAKDEFPSQHLEMAELSPGWNSNDNVWMNQSYPHLHNESEIIGYVNALTFEMCSGIWDKINNLNSTDSKMLLLKLLQ